MWSLTWVTCYQNLPSSLQWWNNLCQWLNTLKNVPETIQWIKKGWILRKNRLNFKLKHKKPILSRRFGDPYGRAGDQCRNRDFQIIWESALENFYFLQNSFRRCERHVLIINVFWDELCQLQFILIPAVYTCGSLDIWK